MRKIYMLLTRFLFVLVIFISIQSIANPFENNRFSGQSTTVDYKKIEFSTLTDHVVYKEIEDPFWELDYDVLDKLAVIVDYQDAKELGEKMTEQQTKEHDKLKAELKKQKVDVDGLLAIRQQMIAQWEAQNESFNPLIVNKNIEIRGFVLPIEWQGKKLSEFLLVPFVGACIHKPTPPPNQIIYAKLKTPMDFPNLSLFASVTVKGFLISKLQSPELTLVDGTQPVTTTYELNTESVEVDSVSMHSW